MEDTTEERVLFPAKPKRNALLGWQIIRFLLHLAAVYGIAKFSTPWLAAWTRNTLLPILQRPSSSSSGFEFLFSHIFVFSFGPAFLAGLVNAKFKHRVAEFVWLVPAAILAYKFFTFSTATSVLRNQFWPVLSAFHQYFGGGFLVPDYRNWEGFWTNVASTPDMMRGMAQLTFTAPFYAGVGYSVGAWIGVRTELDRKVAEKVKNWEKWKFGRRA